MLKPILMNDIVPGKTGRQVKRSITKSKKLTIDKFIEKYNDKNGIE